jgi:hypothetical protein
MSKSKKNDITQIQNRLDHNAYGILDKALFDDMRYLLEEIKRLDQENKDLVDELWDTKERFA